jgi:hypothetical protein
MTKKINHNPYSQVHDQTRMLIINTNDYPFKIPLDIYREYNYTLIFAITQDYIKQTQ